VKNIAKKLTFLPVFVLKSKKYFVWGRGTRRARQFLFTLYVFRYQYVCCVKISGKNIQK
jgi:hypothetical protein